MAWWNTSIYYRKDDLQKALVANGKKFTKLETAYSDWNYLLGKAKCANCVFFQGDGNCQFTEGLKEDGLSIKPNGLCHAITTDPPSSLEYYYVSIPPNGTNVIYGIVGGIGYYLLYKQKKKSYYR
jgi:hypothetical protein